MSQSLQPAIANVLQRADAEGVRLWADNGSIHYRCPGPIGPTLRDLIIANKPALLAALVAWDAPEALRLESEADGLAERLNVSGSEPGIQDLAGRCVAAHYAHDMTGVRSACALIEDRARVLDARLREAA